MTIRNYRFKPEPLWRVYAKDFIIWALLVLLATCLGFTLSPKAHSAELSWGFQIPYDSWRTKNAEFYMLELKTHNLWPWIDGFTNHVVIQAQTSRTVSEDGRLFGGHWRVCHQWKSLRFFGGFGLRVGSDDMAYGPSHVLGHFGLNVVIPVRNVVITTGIVHYSDPLYHHDKGRNFLTLGLAW